MPGAELTRDPAVSLDVSLLWEGVPACDQWLWGTGKGRKLCGEPHACLMMETSGSVSARGMDTYIAITLWACEESLTQRA